MTITKVSFEILRVELYIIGIRLSWKLVLLPRYCYRDYWLSGRRTRTRFQKQISRARKSIKAIQFGFSTNRAHHDKTDLYSIQITIIVFITSRKTKQQFLSACAEPNIIRWRLKRCRILQRYSLTAARARDGVKWLDLDWSSRAVDSGSVRACVKRLDGGTCP